MSEIARIIAQDPVGMKQLRAVRSLGLPDWCIAAGFVRSRVREDLHGISPPRPPVDIDVLYYDQADLSKAPELAFEAEHFPRRGRSATRRACTCRRSCHRTPACNRTP